jgi:LysM repeat protein
MHFRTILAVFLLTGIALAQGNLPPPKGGTTIYVVEPGDSLWKISGRFFGNPLFWPRLWEINSYIDNPNRIYPGDVIALKAKQPDIPVVKVEPKAHKVSFEDIEPPPPVYYYSQGGSEGFITPDEWEHMGTILTSEPPKILLGEGDIVFTNVGSKNGVDVGDMFTIFRSSKPVFHPITGQQIGYKVQIEGELELMEILGKRKSTAIITSSYLEITRGAKVRPREPFVKEVILRKGTQRVDGFIVDNKNNTELSGKGDIVYIDAGQVNNVVPGNVFSIYTQPRKAHDPDAHKDVIIPGTLIGKIVVLEVKEKSATGIITESSRQIELGDVVSLDI